VENICLPFLNVGYFPPLYPALLPFCLREGIPGLRHNRIKNKSSGFKHTRRPRLVKTEALFGWDRGLF
jgi:hypothetical protein